MTLVLCQTCGRIERDDKAFLGDGGWKCEQCGRLVRGQKPTNGGKRAMPNMTLSECEYEIENLLENIAHGAVNDTDQINAEFLLEQWKLLKDEDRRATKADAIHDFVEGTIGTGR